MKNLFIILVAINILTVGLAKAQEKTKQEKGYFNLTEMSFFATNHSLGLKGTPSTVINRSAGGFSLRNINGWFVTNKISLGVGFAQENHTLAGVFARNSNVTLLFADARYYFKNAKSTFYVYGNAGGTIILFDPSDDGTMLALGAGYKFKIAKRTAMAASLGYNNLAITTNKNLLESYNGLAIRIGFLL